jgi:hypothetical protein
MPAYIQHRQHHEVEPFAIVCPCCLRLPMHVVEVQPHWSMTKLDFIYECADCGIEVKKTVAKAELPN